MAISKHFNDAEFIAVLCVSMVREALNYVSNSNGLLVACLVPFWFVTFVKFVNQFKVFNDRLPYTVYGISYSDLNLKN